jgi:bifunctional UDP-N-acetylglucosamine pyrophosphorylase/glucosamine-1-phosphate N-acetyltransferase
MLTRLCAKMSTPTERENMSVSAAIILAAGEGVRMHSRTPKVLHTFAGKTFLSRILSAVQGLHPGKIVVVVRHCGEQVAQAAQAQIPDVCIVNQDEIPGTGRAVQCAVTALGNDFIQSAQGPIVVTAADMPLLDTATLSSLVSSHESQHNTATVLSMELDQPFGYGRIVRASDGSFDKIVEERDASESEKKITEVNTSVYAFDPHVLADSIAHLDANNDQKEFYLTDALAAARTSGHVGVCKAADSLVVSGVNDRIQLAKLEKAYHLRICEKWMRAGVTIDDPATTWIDDDVEIGQDAEILPGCFLKGATKIGEGAIVGPYSTLTDTVIESSHIGARVDIGPWTHMRFASNFADDTKAGAFVETKNATVDHGTKVPHLIYVGDAHIGHDSNLGGGTITANWDGKNKLHTEIGSGVHIGAGNMIVAPVQIGDNVTTGAGAVVRHPVHDQSLVFSENTQHEVRNWVPRYQRTKENWDFDKNMPLADEKSDSHNDSHKGE